MKQDLEYVRAMAMINARRARREAKMREKKTKFVEVRYIQDLERYCTAYKESEAVKMLEKLTSEGATIVKVLRFEA